MGQRRLLPGFLGAFALAVALWSAPVAAEDEPPPAALEPPSDRPTVPFSLGVGGGYAFRPADDGRNHGGAAHLYGDVPLLWDFGLRLETGMMAWGPSADADRPLLRGLVAPQLIYALDDTEAVAIFGIGGFGWSEVEIDDPQPGAIFGAGAIVTIGARFPLVPGLDAEAAVRVPFVLWRNVVPPDDLFPVTILGNLGVVVRPVELLQAFSEPAP